VGIGLNIGTGAYAEASANGPLAPLPADRWMAWLSYWTSIPVIYGLTAFLLLLFPNGHLVSPRWRFGAWFVGGGVAAVRCAFELRRRGTK